MNKLTIYLTAIMMMALIPMTGFANDLQVDYKTVHTANFIFK